MAIGRIVDNKRVAALSEITPYEKNPRWIPQDAVDAVARSIDTYGFRQPIIVDQDGVIVAGHTRHKAAKQLGLEEVWIESAHELTPEQVQAFRLVDNRSHEFSGWDIELLSAEVSAIKDALEDDEDLIGFDDDEIAQLEALGHEYQDVEDEPVRLDAVEDEDAVAPDMVSLYFLVPRRLASDLRVKINAFIAEYTAQNEPTDEEEEQDDDGIDEDREEVPVG